MKIYLIDQPDFLIDWLHFVGGLCLLDLRVRQFSLFFWVYIGLLNVSTLSWMFDCSCLYRLHARSFGLVLDNFWIVDTFD